jgi:uncharacterized protein YggE
MQFVFVKVDIRNPLAACEARQKHLCEKNVQSQTSGAGRRHTGACEKESTDMNIRRIFLAGIGLILCGSTLAATLPDAPHLEVQGAGEIRAVPDQMILNLTQQATHRQLSAASDAVAEKTARVLAAARKAGIPDQAIQAAHISSAPRYDWIDRQQVFKGYQVRQHIRIRLDDISKYAPLLQDLMGIDGTVLSQTSLDFSNRQVLERQALALAIEDAGATAVAMAESAGVRLGDVWRMTTRPAGTPGIQPLRLGTAAMDEGAPRPEVSIGEETIRVTVDMVFRLDSEISIDADQ